MRLLICLALFSSTTFADEISFIWNQGIVAATPYVGNGFHGSSINNNRDVAGSLGAGATIWNGTTFTSLQTPAGYTFSIADSVSDNGSVAGVSEARDGHTEPTLRTNGPPAILGLLPGFIGGYGSSINNHDQVVGQLIVTLGGSAFLWSNGTMNTLQLLAGFSISNASAINSAGAIVGYVETANLSTMQAVFWQNGSIAALPNPSGCSNSMATDINELGEISGTCGSEAVVWINGAPIVIGPGSALSINDSGTVVGATNLRDRTSSDAFTWTAASGTYLLPGFFSGAQAYGINDNGDIFGVGDTTLVTPEPGWDALCGIGLLGLIVLLQDVRRREIRVLNP